MSPGGFLHAQQPVTGPVILLIGPPGSGKSTQASALAKKRSLPVISVESLIQQDPGAFEKNRTKGITGLARDSDPFLNHLFAMRLEQPGLTGGFILDGYPATKDHADFIAKLATEGRLPKSALVLQLDIPDDVARKRMAGQPGADSLEQRLKDYHREMDMVRLYFPNADIQTIDARPKSGDVSRKIESILKKKLSQQ